MIRRVRAGRAAVTAIATVALAAALALASIPAGAQNPPGAPAAPAAGQPAVVVPAEAVAAPAAVDVGQLGDLLLAFLVVAILLESALSLLFQWRLYREFFNGQGMKTLVMFAFAYALVQLIPFDVVADLIRALRPASGATGWLTEVLSAMILAGGSAGVYRLFLSLGIRSPITPVEEERKPPTGKAYVSVKVRHTQRVDEIRVTIGETGDVAASAAPPLVGVLRTGSVWARLRSVFTADPERFPSYGGYTLDTRNAYEIAVRGIRQNEVVFDVPVYTGRFAERAIVDFVVSV